MKQRIMLKDIRGAERDSWKQCPLARAIRRTFPGTDVDVFDTGLCINGYSFAHTADSRAFALAWNNGPVRPTTIEIPDIAHRLNPLPKS